jgi:hypothetical protein
MFLLRQFGGLSLERDGAPRDELTGSRKPLILLAILAVDDVVSRDRLLAVAAPLAAVFAEFTALGGDRGWLYMDRAWRLRGALDRLLGGMGLRRGRRDPREVRAGDTLDFWRVEAVERDRLLLLRAEMKVPGEAWLLFEVAAAPGGTTQLTQTAFFAPRGLAGWLYWHALYPVHALIFRGLIERIGRQAEVAPG